jgi:hypothetical protein
MPFLSSLASPLDLFPSPPGPSSSSSIRLKLAITL